MRLQQKVAIVTGGGAGIGRATARRFAREGAAVVVADKDGAGAEATANMIEAAGSEAVALTVDVSQAREVERLVASTIARFGRLHVLVNNAASSRSRRVTDLSEEDWQFTLENCLSSVYLGAKHAIPHMIEAGGGSIVNISSVNGLITNPGFSAYSAAKAGVLGLTRSLALDYGPVGIRVNAICPGFIANERSGAALAADPLEGWAMTETQPLGRYGVPDDIASAALFLASDEAGYMTGATMVVDGGLTIQSPEALLRPSFRRRWRSGRLVLQED